MGAPKGTFPGGLDNLVEPTSQPENETGLVYDCPLNSGPCGPVGRSVGAGIFDRRLFDDQSAYSVCVCVCVYVRV